MYDVHVVGGGPVGCICARELARSGMKVLVSEEHSRIGIPVQCSGLISVDGLNSLGVDYSRAVMNRVSGARIYSPRMNEIVVGDGKTRACVVDRSMLDIILSDQAEAEGAHIRLEDRVKRSTLNGRIVVGADGAASSVVSWFGFPPISEFAICMQADYSEVRVSDCSNIELFLSNERFPGFFGWLIPTGKDSARVGLGAHAQFKGAVPPIKKLFEAFVSSKHVADALDGAREDVRIAGIIPMKMREKTVESSILLVGDAAGQAKATTGGGIVFGCAAARIAAKCIASGEISRYEESWRSELGEDLLLHYKLRSIFNSLTDSRIESLFGMAKMLGVESFLNRFGEMDKPTKMVEKLKEKSYAPIYAAYSMLME